MHACAVRQTCGKHYTQTQIKTWLKGRSPESYHKAIEKREMYVAKGFYKKHGFVKIRNDVLSRNGVDLPIVIMEYEAS